MIDFFINFKLIPSHIGRRNGAFYGLIKLLTSKKGAISVEYALSMAIAVIIMIGVQALFEQMSLDILDQFITWVTEYP